MHFPFSSERKVAWNLSEQLGQIEWAIEETDPQHFEQELRGLYPRLERFGMKMPLVDPVRIADSTYDGTWYSFHLTFLKFLRRWVRRGEFNLEEWNSSVIRESAKRKEYADQHLRQSSRESQT